MKRVVYREIEVNPEDDRFCGISDCPHYRFGVRCRGNQPQCEVGFGGTKEGDPPLYMDESTGRVPRTPMCLKAEAPGDRTEVHRLVKVGIEVHDKFGSRCSIKCPHHNYSRGWRHWHYDGSPFACHLFWDFGEHPTSEKEVKKGDISRCDKCLAAERKAPR